MFSLAHNNRGQTIGGRPRFYGALPGGIETVVCPRFTALYVGTSENMYDRFRTHLGRGEGKTTWALYLSAWAVPLNTKFVVDYYELKETTTEDVELIEGVLWDSLRPLFGKKGGK